MMMKEKVIKIMVPAYVTAMYPNTLGRSTAVSAVAKGMSKEDIKRLGRWKSDAVDVDINNPLPSALAASLLSPQSRFASLGPSSLTPSG